MKSDISEGNNKMLKDCAFFATSMQYLVKLIKSVKRKIMFGTASDWNTQYTAFVEEEHSTSGY